MRLRKVSSDVSALHDGHAVSFCVTGVFVEAGADSLCWTTLDGMFAWFTVRVMGDRCYSGTPNCLRSLSFVDLVWPLTRFFHCLVAFRFS